MPNSMWTTLWTIAFGSSRKVCCSSRDYCRDRKSMKNYPLKSMACDSRHSAVTIGFVTARLCITEPLVAFPAAASRAKIHVFQCCAAIMLFDRYLGRGPRRRPVCVIKISCVATRTSCKTCANTLSTGKQKKFPILSTQPVDNFVDNVRKTVFSL